MSLAAREPGAPVARPTGMRPAVLATAVLCALVVSGCTDEPADRDRSTGPTTAVVEPELAPPLRMPGVSGGCGNAYFYYVGADDRSAVIITSDLLNRSAREDTVVEVTLPSRQVEVVFQQGTGLRWPQCNDTGRAEVDREVAVVRGTVVITVDPRIRGGGLVDGSARLTGAATQDGTPLPDLQISSDRIGFYAG